MILENKKNYRLFGIPNCDTVKKVRAYLAQQELAYDFVDFKKSPPTPKDIERWKQFVQDWPVNTKGPTYRKIKDSFEAAGEAEKIKLLIENSSAIRRPILEASGKVVAIGFDQIVKLPLK